MKISIIRKKSILSVDEIIVSLCNVASLMGMAELKYFYNAKHNWFLVVHELAVAYNVKADYVRVLQLKRVWQNEHESLL